MHKDSADVRVAAQALLDRLYASHLPSDAALPHASVEWKDARAKADALRNLLATPSPAPAVAEAVAAERERCAKIVEESPSLAYRWQIAAAIRANGGEG